MWVKICGNTTLADAAHAAAAGADAVGFVFAESPRRMEAARVAEITRELPASVERIGVFGARGAVEIAATALEAGLSGIQLHGGMDEALLEELARRTVPGMVLVQTLHWNIGANAHAGDAVGQLERELDQVAAVAARVGRRVRVLVDSRVGTALGGTGLTFDWPRAAKVLDRAGSQGMQVIAAGGLRPGNVGEAIATLGAWGVDVSSGVEAAPGSKDPVLVAEFIAAARRHGAERP